MKFERNGSFTQVLGIAATSFAFPFVLAGLGILEDIDSGEPLIPKKEVRAEEVRTVEPSHYIRENFCATYVPPVYAIKPEEDVFVRDWRDYSVRTNSKFG